MFYDDLSLDEKPKTSNRPGSMVYGISARFCPLTGRGARTFRIQRAIPWIDRFHRDHRNILKQQDGETLLTSTGTGIDDPTLTQRLHDNRRG